MKLFCISCCGRRFTTDFPSPNLAINAQKTDASEPSVSNFSYQRAPSQAPRIFPPDHVPTLQNQTGAIIASALYASGQMPEITPGAVNFGKSGGLPPEIFKKHVESHLVNYKLMDAVEQEHLEKVRELIAQGGRCLVVKPKTGEKINLVLYVADRKFLAELANHNPLETFHAWDEILEALETCPDYAEACDFQTTTLITFQREMAANTAALNRHILANLN